MATLCKIAFQLHYNKEICNYKWKINIGWHHLPALDFLGDLVHAAMVGLQWKQFHLSDKSVNGNIVKKYLTNTQD